MKMKRYIFSLIVIFEAFGFISSIRAIDVDITTGCKTARGYAWRGCIWEDMVYVQPYATLHFEKLTAGVSINRNLQNKHDSIIRSKLNLSCEYSMMFNGLITSMGIVGYIYDDSSTQTFDDTVDLYCQIAYSTPVVVSLTVYRDIAQIDDLYYLARIAHSIPLNKEGMELSIHLSASAGTKNYNQYMMSRFLSEQDVTEVDDGLVDISSGISLATPVGKNVILTPELRYIRLMDTVRDTVKKAGRDTSAIIYGISLEYSF